MKTYLSVYNYVKESDINCIIISSLRDPRNGVRARDIFCGRGARADSRLLLGRAGELRMRQVAQGDFARGLRGMYCIMT